MAQEELVRDPAYLARSSPWGTQLTLCSSLTVRSKSGLGPYDIILQKLFAVAQSQSFMSLRYLPDVSTLTRLRMLDMSDSQVTIVSDGISQLTNLTFLRLNRNNITNLPEEISCLTRLTLLAIDGNPIRGLRPGITCLQKLEELYIQDVNGVISVEFAPIGISSLPCWNCSTQYGGKTIAKALRGLALYVTREDIGRTTKLDLSKSGLTSIPYYVSDLINLQELSIYGNPIKEIPSWITKLTNKLEKLHIEDPNGWWHSISVNQAPVALKLMKCWQRDWDRKVSLHHMKYQHSDQGLQDQVDKLLSSIKHEELKTNAGEILDVKILQTYKSVGAGAHGVVFEIIYKTNKCALKIPLNANYSAGRFIPLYFEKVKVNAEEVSREFEITTNLEPHQNIVQTLDYVTLSQNVGDNRFMSLIMELADCSLKDEIRRSWSMLSNKEAYNRGKKYVKEILLGLAYLHSKNIVHRDLKTENVLVCRGVAKITDFGLSKRLECRMQPGSSIRGTPYWGPPEYFDGYIKDQKAADIFVVGTILWAMRTRKEPFVGFPTEKQISIILFEGHRLPLPQGNPPFLEDMIARCWHNVPLERKPAYGLLEIMEQFEERHEKEENELTEEYCSGIWGINQAFEDAWKELMKRVNTQGSGFDISVFETEKADKVKYFKFEKYTYQED